METKSKAQTYIGFAMRKGSYKIGVNAIYTLKKAKLLIVCGTAGADTSKNAVKLAKRFGCQLLRLESLPLAEVTHKDYAKLMAITDTALAQAILNQSEKEFTILSLGE